MEDLNLHLCPSMQKNMKTNGKTQRCGGGTFAHEMQAFRAQEAGLSASDIWKSKHSYKSRGASLKQTPHHFLEALEKTKLVVDIIRAPTPFGGGYRSRLGKCIVVCPWVRRIFCNSKLSPYVCALHRPLLPEYNFSKHLHTYVNTNINMSIYVHTY